MTIISKSSAAVSSAAVSSSRNAMSLRWKN
jgi:hypothetical protein